MDESFRSGGNCSFDLNFHGTELVTDGFLKRKPSDEFNKIVLSTKEQTILLNKDELDETILKNILYCYKFLDTNDKEYVNSAEAEMYIRQIKDENPQLFELLFDVLQVASECSPNDSNIAKNLFISRLKTHIDNLKPEDKASFYSLKNNANPISNYFNNMDLNTQSSVSETVFEPVQRTTKEFKNSRQPSVGDVYFNKVLSKMSQDSKETVFNLNSPDNQDQTKGNFKLSSLNHSFVDCSLNQGDMDEFDYDDNQKFDSGLSSAKTSPVDSPERNKTSNKFENLNKFETVDELEKVLNSSDNVNEYIVFNYNLEQDWQHSLRDNSDLLFNV